MWTCVDLIKHMNTSHSVCLRRYRIFFLFLFILTFLLKWFSQHCCRPCFGCSASLCNQHSENVLCECVCGEARASAIPPVNTDGKSNYRGEESCSESGSGERGVFTVRFRQADWHQNGMDLTWAGRDIYIYTFTPARALHPSRCRAGIECFYTHRSATFASDEQWRSLSYSNCFI